MKRKINVAVAQFRSNPGQTEENLKRCMEYVDRAAKEGADIICFPELCHTGYGLDPEQTRRLAGKSTETDFLPRLSRCAKRNGIYVIYSYIEIDEKEDLHISAMLLDRKGNVAGNYRKCYLWGEYEQNIYTPDTHFPVFETELGKIGILICYDIEYPETARKLWKQGVDIIFAPMHFWTIDYMNKYAQAMAIYNTVPVVVVNGVADDKESYSKILDEEARLCMECAAKEEDFIICPVEVGGNSSQREVHRKEYRKEVSF